MNTVNTVMRFLSVTLAIIFLAGCALLVPFDKEPEVKIAVHSQTPPSDSARFAMPLKIPYPPYEIYLSRIPLLTHHDVEQFRSYEADDGTYGALLYLKPHGKMALQQQTMAGAHSYLVAFVNDRVVSTQYVDRPVRDGMYYIEKGLTAEDIAAMAESYDQIGGPTVGKPGASDGDGDALNLGTESGEVFERVGEPGPASVEAPVVEEFPDAGDGSEAFLTVGEEQQRRSQGLDTSASGPQPVAEAGFDQPPIPAGEPAPRAPRTYEPRERPSAETEFYQPPFQ